MRDKITTHELYLETEAGEVVETKEVEDVNAGMYPCYYRQFEDRLQVSNSVVALIKEIGNLDLNENFNPPNYLEEHPIPQLYRKHVMSRFSHIRGTTRLLSILGKLEPDAWYESWETIDNRIKKLKAFETVYQNGESEINFEPDFSLTKEELISKTARNLKEYIHEMEERYPEHEHVILMGGKDSQLIGLVPKKNPENWSVFSSEPNYPLVKEFIEKNNLTINRLFHHDNENDKSLSFLKKKIKASDLYSDPTHMRWPDQLKKISEEFDGKCIFYSGTEADTFYTYFKDFHKDGKDYFKNHFHRAASWQATHHQLAKNISGCPQISPYHSQQMWENVYRHYDPNIIEKGDDLRPRIAEELRDGSIWFPNRNPGPDGIDYQNLEDIDTKSIYLNEIEKELET